MYLPLYSAFCVALGGPSGLEMQHRVKDWGLTPTSFVGNRKYCTLLYSEYVYLVRFGTIEHWELAVNA
jgi:hypothetical protein